MSKKHTNHKSKTPKHLKDEWRTNPEFFKVLNGEFGFVLDAAATIENSLCKRFYTKEDDSLSIPWEIGKKQHFSVFLNPPFSQFRAFLEKCNLEIQKHEKGQIICVIRGDAPESKWFRETLIGRDGFPLHEIRNYYPRVKYLDHTGTLQTNIGFPTSIVIFRPQRIKTVQWHTWKQDQLYLPF